MKKQTAFDDPVIGPILKKVSSLPTLESAIAYILETKQKESFKNNEIFEQELNYILDLLNGNFYDRGGDREVDFENLQIAVKQIIVDKGW